MSIAYEREFRGIVGGDEKVLDAVGATLAPEERAAYAMMREHPFLVVRAAGSMGGADLVALRHDLGFLVEVKSTRESRIHFSDSARLQEQIAQIRYQCERSGVLPLLAFRRKGQRGDAWRLFTLPDLHLSGPAQRLNDMVPKAEKTPRGNDVLAWDHGMPLAEFLRRVTPTGGAVVNIPRARAAIARP